jgi:long-chain acyl-CoA synthetase
MISYELLLKHSKNTAVICSDGSQYNYQELLEYSRTISKRLTSRSLVLCLCENTIGSLAGYLAFTLNDIVPVLLDSSLDRELLDNLVSTYEPQYIWLPTSNIEDIKKGDVVINILGYSLISFPEHRSYPLNDKISLLLSTSGTTGSPKLVKITYENIYSNARAISSYLSINENERAITTLPMHYTFGLSIINSNLMMGATILLTHHSLIEKEFWSFFKKYEASSLSGVPYSYEILKKLRFLKMNLPHLRTMTQAGGKLNSTLLQEFSQANKEKNIRFFVMYGQTEATARMSYLPDEYSLTKFGSIGVAIPGGSFSLISNQGEVITTSDTIGELQYTGPNVSMGYANCGEDLIKGDENQGVLLTGDLAKRDSDGFYYIVGRKTRFLKLFGIRINLDETEQLIKNITADCACTGQDDKLLIYIIDRELIATVENYISVKTGINYRGFKVIYIDAIPKNSSGKTLYTELDNQ